MIRSQLAKNIPFHIYANSYLNEVLTPVVVLPDILQQLLSQIIYRGVKSNYRWWWYPAPPITTWHPVLSLQTSPTDPLVLKQIMSAELILNTDAKPILEWRKFVIDPLNSIPLDVDARFQIYLQSVREQTESGLLRAIGETTYPEDKTLQEAIACLSFFIYNDSGNDGWKDFPDLERVIASQEALSALRKIGAIRQNFAEIDEVGKQKCKVYTVYDLVCRFEEFRDDLVLLHPFVTSAIQAKFDQGSNVLDLIIQKILVQNKMIDTGLYPTPPKRRFRCLFHVRIDCPGGA